MRGVVAVVALGLAACGTDPTPVTCSWFTGQNCYKTMADEAGRCVTGATPGLLSIDRDSCAYDDGTTVTFASPVPISAPLSYPWDLHVDKNGQTCMSFSDAIDTNAGTRHLTLTAASGTFVFDVGGGAWNMTCPDGTVNQISAADAFACGLVGNPGKQTQSSVTRVALQLAGTDTTLTPIFVCAP